MAAQHYLIMLLPEENDVDKMCFKFLEDENITEDTAASTTIQLYNFFKDNQFAEDILTGSLTEHTFNNEMKLKDLLINLMSVNHINKSFLKPYVVETDIIEEIVETGCEYGISIIDCRNPHNIRYCMLLDGITGYDGYVVLSISEYLHAFMDIYSHEKDEKDLTTISEENIQLSKMSTDFELIPQNEIVELFPNLFE